MTTIKSISENVEECGSLLGACNLFHIRMCDFSYPISDPTKMQYLVFRPDHLQNTIFSLCLSLSSVQMGTGKCDVENNPVMD